MALLTEQWEKEDMAPHNIRGRSSVWSSSRHDSGQEHAVASRSAQGSWADRRIGDMDNMPIILGLLCNLENKYLHNDPVLHLVKHRVHSHLELEEYPPGCRLKETHSLGKKTPTGVS